MKRYLDMCAYVLQHRNNYEQYQNFSRISYRFELYVWVSKMQVDVNAAKTPGSDVHHYPHTIPNTWGDEELKNAIEILEWFLNTFGPAE